MLSTPAQVIKTYLFLQFGNTLAASLIWGVNTLMLLDAGLSNFEAFLANAFFTLGMVLFEIPTGIIADRWGRRNSHLLGYIAMAGSTFMYYVLWLTHGPMWGWAIASLLLGLGYTFFSGAVEAWLIDALDELGFKGRIETVFGKALTMTGSAMLIGTLGGGALAQVTNLGVPFLVRTGILLLLFFVTWKIMHDIGFAPDRSEKPFKAIKTLVRQSIDNGFNVPSIRWLMFSSVFLSSTGFYVFYALQPHLLELYGDTDAYLVAGLAAALLAVGQISGGMFASKFVELFAKRTTALMLLTITSALVLIGLWLTSSFIFAVVLVFIWGLVYAASIPVRQTYLNGMVASKQRATVLSFDSMFGNLGGSGIQPLLGKIADASSYGTSFVASGVLQLFALPLLLKSRSKHHPSDIVNMT